MAAAAAAARAAAASAEKGPSKERVSPETHLSGLALLGEDVLVQLDQLQERLWCGVVVTALAVKELLGDLWNDNAHDKP